MIAHIWIEESNRRKEKNYLAIELSFKANLVEQKHPEKSKNFPNFAHGERTRNLSKRRINFKRMMGSRKRKMDYGLCVRKLGIIYIACRKFVSTQFANCN